MSQIDNKLTADRTQPAGPGIDAVSFLVDVSRTFRNKDGYQRRNGYRLNMSFVTERHTPDSFVQDVIRQGWPYTMAHWKRSPAATGAAGRKVSTPKHIENFRSSQVLTFDDDSKAAGVVDWWLSDSFFARYGWLFVESVNSEPGAEKGHPTLLLDRPVSDPLLYKECLMAFCDAYPRLDRLVNIDRTIYNAVGARVHLVGNVCPWVVFEREILEPYRRAEQEKQERIAAARAKAQAERDKAKEEGRTATSDQKTAYISGWLDWLFNKVANAQAGQRPNRHGLIYWAGRSIAGLEGTPWASEYSHLWSDAGARIVDAARDNGYLEDHAHGSKEEVLRTFGAGMLAGGDELDEPTPATERGPAVPEPEPPPTPAIPADIEARVNASSQVEKLERLIRELEPADPVWQWAANEYAQLKDSFPLLVNDTAGPAKIRNKKRIGET